MNTMMNGMNIHSAAASINITRSSTGNQLTAGYQNIDLPEDTPQSSIVFDPQSCMKRKIVLLCEKYIENDCDLEVNISCRCRLNLLKKKDKIIGLKVAECKGIFHEVMNEIYLLMNGSLPRFKVQPAYTDMIEQMELVHSLDNASPQTQCLSSVSSDITVIEEEEEEKDEEEDEDEVAQAMNELFGGIGIMNSSEAIKHDRTPTLKSHSHGLMQKLETRFKRLSEPLRNDKNEKGDQMLADVGGATPDIQLAMDACSAPTPNDKKLKTTSLIRHNSADGIYVTIIDEENEQDNLDGNMLQLRVEKELSLYDWTTV